MRLVDCVPSTLPHGRAGLIFLLRYVCLADSQGGMESLRLPPSLCSMCTARRATAWRQTRVRHTKTLSEPGRKHSLAQKAYQIVNKFSGDVGGDAAPPTFVCIRRICRLRRSLILLAKSIPYKFGRPLVERICHFFHTLKPLAEPVASWSGLAMYAHFYTGFSGNVIDFPTRRDKRASRAQNRRFPGTGSIPHNLFRAISR